MPTLILGQDLLFWVAILLTVVFFADLATCWWATGLRICPLRKYQDKLIKYHQYTRILLIILIILHLIFHVLFQVYGIIL